MSGRLNKVESRFDKAFPKVGEFVVSGAKGTGFCSGDSGGPTFLAPSSGRLVILGVNVRSPDCEHGIGANTDVRQFIDWIAEHSSPASRGSPQGSPAGQVGSGSKSVFSQTGVGSSSVGQAGAGSKSVFSQAGVGSSSVGQVGAGSPSVFLQTGVGSSSVGRVAPGSTSTGRAAIGSASVGAGSGSVGGVDR